MYGCGAVGLELARIVARFSSLTLHLGVSFVNIVSSLLLLLLLSHVRETLWLP